MLGFLNAGLQFIAWSLSHNNRNAVKKMRAKPRLYVQKRESTNGQDDISNLTTYI